jgi:hypothetical protein
MDLGAVSNIHHGVLGYVHVRGSAVDPHWSIIFHCDTGASMYIHTAMLDPNMGVASCADPCPVSGMNN